MNTAGVYEQWEGDRVRELFEGHAGTSEIGNADNSDHRITDDESDDGEMGIKPVRGGDEGKAVHPVPSGENPNSSTL